MRRIASLLVTALNLGLTGPAIAHDRGPVLDVPAPASFGILASVAQNAPACHTAVFHAGDYPADPLTVERITCLDASCHSREITLCPLTD